MVKKSVLFEVLGCGPRPAWGMEQGRSGGIMPQTVLLVDDSNTVRKAAELVCAKGDFRLVTAGDENEAVVQAHEQQPSLLVVDCQMQERSGYELVRNLRQDAKVSGIPVIMLSGTQNPYDEAQGKDVGALGHLLKPFDTETFVTCITEILEQIPPEGHMDSIPPSTLPTPAQNAELNESHLTDHGSNGKSQEPSHFEINMDESMPPTPIRRATASIIQEVADEEILSEEEAIAAAEEDVDAVGTEAEVEEIEAEETEAEETEAEETEAEEIEAEETEAEEIEAEEIEAEETEAEEAEVEEMTESTAPEMAAAGESTEEGAAATGVDHSELVQAALSRIPREELESMIRATVESVVWEVVPELAESLIKAEIQRILSTKTDS